MCTGGIRVYAGEILLTLSILRKISMASFIPLQITGSCTLTWSWSNIGEVFNVSASPAEADY